MSEQQKRTETILIVDDDKFLLDMYTLKFKESGCTVEAMSDPGDALNRLRGGFAPQVVLLDVVMPTMTGFEFLEAIKKENLAKGATLIVLSNQGQEDDINKATSLGASGYIIKASSIPSEVLTKAMEIVDAKK